MIIAAGSRLTRRHEVDGKVVKAINCLEPDGAGPQNPRVNIADPLRRPLPLQRPVSPRRPLFRI
jgi:hypothetical protein